MSFSKARSATPDLLVRALPKVLAERPDVTTLIVGGNDRQIRRLGDLALALGVQSCVRLLGARPESEMATFLAASFSARRKTSTA